MLRQPGHEVAGFTDSETGLDAVRAGEFDVLVTDMLMPRTDGVEIIRALRELKPQLWIVAISGGGRAMPANSTLKISSAFGADRVLHKPFSKTELLDAIHKR